MRVTLRRAVAGAATALVLALPGAAAAATVEERPVPSLAEHAGRVTQTLVRVHDPLPSDAGPHPEACDWLEALRYRDPGGPATASEADAVVVLIPGFLGGAGSFDQLARLTVERAARQGASIEVWALDRRANCLEDDTGVEAAAQARDPSVAYGYYWGGQEVAGRRFGGFVAPAGAAFLSGFGLERTVRDWYAVLRAAVPDRATRERKVLCGGHSLGGFLTAALASWDLEDGDPATTEDAGYRQCAGFVALDTSVSLLAGDGLLPAGTDLLGELATTAVPYVNVPPLTPETIQLPAVFGVGAFFHPQRTDLLEQLPHTPNIDLAQRVLFSRDAVNFATGMPGIRDFTTTNQVTLAGVFDDNSAPLSFLRASVGFLAGGPVVEKNFPLPDPTLGLPGDPATPLYRWEDYDVTGTDGHPIATNSDGEPFTNRESEVSSVTDLARTMFEAPANFIEQYFPVRILTDVVAAAAGDRGGSLSGLQHDGPAMRPTVQIDGGESDANPGDDSGPPVAGEPPNDHTLSRQLTLPGYNHLDVLTAARRQNDGRREPASAALASFALDVVGARRTERARPALRVRVSPTRDARGARRFTTRATLVPPATLARAVACAGRISVQVKAGRSTLSTRRARIGRRSCRATSSVAFRRPERFGGRARLRFVVRYLGSQRLAPVRARVRTARVR